MRSDLPVFYYRDHFLEMLNFVEKTYGGILNAAHAGFIGDFRALSQPQQCLYVRMVNRRGHVFSTAALQYAEIPGGGQVLRSLVDQGFARDLRPDDYFAWLSLFTKAALLNLIGRAGVKAAAGTVSKPALIEHIVARLPYAEASTLVDPAGYIVQDRQAALDYLLFLYFGKTRADLKNFALRDLGIIRVHGRDDYAARFSCADEARECFALSRLLQTLEQSRDADYQAAADALIGLEAPDSAYGRLLRSKAAFIVGRYFERQKRFDRALDCYRLSDLSEARQKMVRLLFGQNRKDEVRQLLRDMLDHPGADDDYSFAEDFYARKFNGERLSTPTALLRGGTDVNIDEAYRRFPEEGVAAFFRRQGWRVWHAENGLWQHLFGLLFWEELYGGQSLLHSAFDRVPQSLKDNSFAGRYSERIGDKLARIRGRQALPLVLQALTENFGRPNGIFVWSMIDADALTALLNHADGDALAAILSAMAADYRAMRDGFPDLMLIRDGRLKFAEVKAEGDVVRRNQLTRMRQLRQAGFQCDLYRARYRYDPGQSYAVIDVETTGGRRTVDRITEVGAVKIRNRRIVAEWHSLVNPQRPIPAYVAGLTGISNDMVKTAPLFGEIADSLYDFIDGSIFVAHNVHFDYGFVAAEFARLGRGFRFPKLCTCAQMRRHYPGHSSYSLARLCERHGIAPAARHRALADAKAAAELLNLINARRSGNGAD